MRTVCNCTEIGKLLCVCDNKIKHCQHKLAKQRHLVACIGKEIWA